jgi:hypothetical protein
MSEYQYFEFAAVDRALTPQQQAELRSRSTRATITAGSFINEYHWGGLKGDPLEWMQRYFDAHVYSANWGQCRLMLRLPVSSFDRSMVDACVRRRSGRASPRFEQALEASVGREHCILGFSFNDESGDLERFWGQTDGPGWMARLLPLRDELLRGDLRPLYLGWLARVCADECDDEDIEPPLPAGLATLTPSQQALVEFLELDPDWLHAAAAASPQQAPAADPAYATWLAEQSPASLRERVQLLLESRGQEAERGARLAFLAWQAQRKPQQVYATRRRVAEIQLGVAAARKRRLEADRRLKAAKEAERQAKHAAHLASLAAAPQLRWQEIDGVLKRGTGAAYDQALRLAQELAEALKTHDRRPEFDKGLVRLLATHGKRPAWVARLEKAGLLWKTKR